MVRKMPSAYLLTDLLVHYLELYLLSLTWHYHSHNNSLAYKITFSIQIKRKLPQCNNKSKRRHLAKATHVDNQLWEREPMKDIPQHVLRKIHRCTIWAKMFEWQFFRKKILFSHQNFLFRPILRTFLSTFLFLVIYHINCYICLIFLRCSFSVATSAARHPSKTAFHHCISQFITAHWDIPLDLLLNPAGWESVIQGTTVVKAKNYEEWTRVEAAPKIKEWNTNLRWCNW